MNILQPFTRKILIYGVWFVIVSSLFFLPFDFHHNVRLGAVPFVSFLYLDGEGMSPGGYMWNGYQVHFLPVQFVITLVLWAGSLFAVHKWLESLDAKAEVD